MEQFLIPRIDKHQENFPQRAALFCTSEQSGKRENDFFNISACYQQAASPSSLGLSGALPPDTIPEHTFHWIVISLACSLTCVYFCWKGQTIWFPNPRYNSQCVFYFQRLSREYKTLLCWNNSENTFGKLLVPRYQTTLGASIRWHAENMRTWLIPNQIKDPVLFCGSLFWRLFKRWFSLSM